MLLAHTSTLSSPAAARSPSQPLVTQMSSLSAVAAVAALTTVEVAALVASGTLR